MIPRQKKLLAAPAPQKKQTLTERVLQKTSEHEICPISRQMPLAHKAIILDCSHFFGMPEIIRHFVFKPEPACSLCRAEFDMNITLQNYYDHLSRCPNPADPDHAMPAKIKLETLLELLAIVHAELKEQFSEKTSDNIQAILTVEMTLVRYSIQAANEYQATLITDSQSPHVAERRSRAAFEASSSEPNSDITVTEKMHLLADYYFETLAMLGERIETLRSNSSFPTMVTFCNIAANFLEQNREFEPYLESVPETTLRRDAMRAQFHPLITTLLETIAAWASQIHDVQNQLFTAYFDYVTRYEPQQTPPLLFYGVDITGQQCLHAATAVADADTHSQNFERTLFEIHVSLFRLALHHNMRSEDPETIGITIKLCLDITSPAFDPLLRRHSELLGQIALILETIADLPSKAVAIFLTERNHTPASLIYPQRCTDAAALRDSSHQNIPALILYLSDSAQLYKNFSAILLLLTDIDQHHYHLDEQTLKLFSDTVCIFVVNQSHYNPEYVQPFKQMVWLMDRLVPEESPEAIRYKAQNHALMIMATEDTWHSFSAYPADKSDETHIVIPDYLSETREIVRPFLEFARQLPDPKTLIPQDKRAKLFSYFEKNQAIWEALLNLIDRHETETATDALAGLKIATNQNHAYWAWISITCAHLLFQSRPEDQRAELHRQALHCILENCHRDRLDIPFFDLTQMLASQRPISEEAHRSAMRIRLEFLFYMIASKDLPTTMPATLRHLRPIFVQDAPLIWSDPIAKSQLMRISAPDIYYLRHIQTNLLYDIFRESGIDDAEFQHVMLEVALQQNSYEVVASAAAALIRLDDSRLQHRRTACAVINTLLQHRIHKETHSAHICALDPKIMQSLSDFLAIPPLLANPAYAETLSHIFVHLAVLVSLHSTSEAVAAFKTAQKLCPPEKQGTLLSQFESNALKFLDTLRYYHENALPFMHFVALCSALILDERQPEAGAAVLRLQCPFFIAFGDEPYSMSNAYRVTPNYEETKTLIPFMKCVPLVYQSNHPSLMPPYTRSNQFSS